MLTPFVRPCRGKIAYCAARIPSTPSAYLSRSSRYKGGRTLLSGCCSSCWVLAENDRNWTIQPQMNADKDQPRMRCELTRIWLTPQDLGHSPYCRLHRCQDGSASTNRLFHLGLPHSLKAIPTPAGSGCNRTRRNPITPTLRSLGRRFEDDDSLSDRSFLRSHGRSVRQRCQERSASSTNAYSTVGLRSLRPTAERRNAERRERRTRSASIRGWS